MENKKSKKVLVIALIAFVLVGLIVFGISYALKDDGNFLHNQKVNGLSFENAKVEYKNDKSDFSVIVYNENEDTMNVKSIEIQMIDKDNKEVSMVVELDGALESDEGRKIIIDNIDYDLSDYNKISYTINK